MQLFLFKMIKKIKLTKEQKEIVENWIKNNGCANFDFKNKDIILYDGWLFSIEKTTKIKPRTRMILSKKPEESMINGKLQRFFPCKFIPIRKNGKIVKEKVEYFHAALWFEELDETINYFKRMKKLLNQLGYKTSTK